MTTALRHEKEEGQIATKSPHYPVRTLATASKASKPALQELEKAFGTLPNIAGVLANSPKLIQSLVGLFQQVHTSSLTEQEIQIVLLADAVANSCCYAVAFHSALAAQQGVSSDVIEAIRERQAPTDIRLAALFRLATTLIEKRGHAAPQELDSFVDAGFTREQVLEVIAVIAASTITNYAGTIAQPPLEAAFQPYAWEG